MDHRGYNFGVLLSSVPMEGMYIGSMFLTYNTGASYSGSTRALGARSLGSLPAGRRGLQFGV